MQSTRSCIRILGVVPQHGKEHAAVQLAHLQETSSWNGGLSLTTALPCSSACTAVAACLLVQIESRFRFLAADSTATMRGKRPSYKEALLLIRDRSAVQLGITAWLHSLAVQLGTTVAQQQQLWSRQYCIRVSAGRTCLGVVYCSYAAAVGWLYGPGLFRWQYDARTSQAGAYPFLHQTRVTVAVKGLVAELWWCHSCQKSRPSA
jgi:hypothetical protein